VKIFLDTNIILDLLLEREGYEDSAVLFQMQEDGELKLFVSILTMVNVSYIYKKTVGEAMAAANLKYLSALVEVLPMDGDQLQLALMMGGRDFEDALQAVCAAEAGCDYIVTRNDRDFRLRAGAVKKYRIPEVTTPAGFLSGVRV
jgi:Predicted nucleic acid-binding protein, contains PIN domain